MNIFFLDMSAKTAAEQLCDKHVVKMTTETVQIISTAYFLLTGTQGLYKPTHKHHPCVIWATQSFDNFKWLLVYSMFLGEEYTKRYGKKHLAESKLQDWLKTNALVTMKFPETGWTNPPQCMPEQYKQASLVQAYRAYYIGEKLKFAEWKYTKKPEWL
jgi:hypothetical protein